jgi:hypothetical protein
MRKQLLKEEGDDEITLEPWDAFKNAILTVLKNKYGVNLSKEYNLVLETGRDHETNIVKRKGIHVANYYESLLQEEGYEDLEDLIGLAEDRLPENFELGSYEDVKELASALCMDSAYGLVSLVVDDYILLDVREENVGLDGNKQVVNKVGATSFTSFSQNEVKQFQKIAGIIK